MGLTAGLQEVARAILPHREQQSKKSLYTQRSPYLKVIMASSGEQEMQLCGNCKRDIPLVNFTMHEVHCRRNISLCQKCNEPIPTSEMEEHMATEHVSVTCKCNMIMEKNLLEEHKCTSCPLRLLQCQFCELELAFNKLGDHEKYCGARTERCDKCGSSVMTKDLKNHPVACGKVPEQKKPAGAQTGADEEYKGAWFDSLENRNISTHNMFSYVPSRFHGRSVLTRSLKTSNEELERNRREQKRADDTQLPCEFCEELFPVEDLILHQSACSLPSATSNSQSSRSTIPDFTENSRSSSSPVHSSGVLLPCEFCGIALEADILFHHQDQCEMCPDSERSSPHTPALPSIDVSDYEEGSRNSSHGHPTVVQSHSLYRTEMHNVGTSLYTRRGNVSKPPRPTRTSLLASDHYRQPKVNNFSARHSNVEEMRKRNMEENMRLVQNQRHDNPPASGASERNNGTRSKVTNNRMNPGDVDKEE